ncbi:MAG: TIGR00282 family metallophosphoesterase [Clostridiales bacterium]
MKVLFIGDIIGNPGRKFIGRRLGAIKKDIDCDLCIVNGENSANGNGITYYIANELYNAGVDAITLGNHTWSKREIMNFIDVEKRIVRPANYPKELPGRGSTVINVKDKKVAIINVMGRVFMDNVDCPFKAVEREIEYVKDFTNIIIVDFHAEATSEKNAFKWFLNGKASLLVGTHTHVQTADERVLNQGTAYITDVGMTGPSDGVIGFDKNIIIQKFLTLLPARYEVAKGKVQLNAVVVDIDENSGKALGIERINTIYNDF